jgi:hypothetical protein
MATSAGVAAQAKQAAATLEMGNVSTSSARLLVALLTALFSADVEERFPDQARKRIPGSLGQRKTVHGPCPRCRQAHHFLPGKSVRNQLTVDRWCVNLFLEMVDCALICLATVRSVALEPHCRRASRKIPKVFWNFPLPVHEWKPASGPWVHNQCAHFPSITE